MQLEESLGTACHAPTALLAKIDFGHFHGLFRGIHDYPFRVLRSKGVV
jgi:hypothetical protein